MLHISFVNLKVAEYILLFIGSGQSPNHNSYHPVKWWWFLVALMSPEKVIQCLLSMIMLIALVCIQEHRHLPPSVLIKNCSIWCIQPRFSLNSPLDSPGFSFKHFWMAGSSLCERLLDLTSPLWTAESHLSQSGRVPVGYMWEYPKACSDSELHGRVGDGWEWLKRPMAWKVFKVHTVHVILLLQQ